MKTRAILAYTCERCGAEAPAATEFAADQPAGFYLNLRRVTEAGNHYLSDEVYLCGKSCLVEHMQYGISASVTPFRPIGKANK